MIYKGKTPRPLTKPYQ